MNAELLNACEQAINYRFNDQAWLRLALTHCSAVSQYGEHNERLEFVGDGLINNIIAQQLFDQFPQATEGELSRLRASLVSGAALAQLAQRLDLSGYIQLGPGEQKTGGRRRESNLAGLMEAILGAIYQDSDFTQCQRCVLHWYQTALSELDLNQLAIIDAKTTLQEYLQARKLALPVYTVVAQSGKAHEQQFVVHCYIDGYGQPSKGEGASRRKAEQAAAKNMLKRLSND